MPSPGSTPVVAAAMCQSLAPMRAVAITAPGGPGVLDVTARDVRPAGAGEVRVAVRAAAVNPTDTGLRARGADGLEPPWIPGMDAAGVVESVGAGGGPGPAREEGMAPGAPRRPGGGAPARPLPGAPAPGVRGPPGGAPPRAAALA